MFTHLTTDELLDDMIRSAANVTTLTELVQAARRRGDDTRTQESVRRVRIALARLTAAAAELEQAI